MASARYVTKCELNHIEVKHIHLPPKAKLGALPVLWLGPALRLKPICACAKRRPRVNEQSGP